MSQTLSQEDLLIKNKLLQEQLSLFNGKKKLLQEQLSLFKGENKLLKEQLDWFKRQVFGKKSEKIKEEPKEQLHFDGFGNLKKIEIEKTQIKTHSRKKQKREGQEAITLPADLPVEEIVLDIPKEEKICPKTNKPLIKIGEEISHKLAYRPGKCFLKKFIRPKYGLPNGEGIAVAAMPDNLLLKCRADESLLSDIAVRKFADHLPLYRLSEIFSREGIFISRKLLSQWMIKIGMALKPLYKEMKKQILATNNIFIDETCVKMQKIGKCKQTYMWVIANETYRIYDFRENHNHSNVSEILGSYNGVLHSDKYGAYEKLANEKKIIWCPCWAHIRRKFFESSGSPPFRKWVLRKIRYLFMLERVAWNRTQEERLVIRKEKEIPIIDELIEKIKEKLQENILPKSKLRKAIGYFYGLIPYLKNYTKYPNARLDNNVAERAIRPIAIGRKNWLFFGSPKGGEAGAVMMSFIQTCRGLGINPRDYLEDVMRRLMGYKANKLQELLPDQWIKKKALNKF